MPNPEYCKFNYQDALNLDSQLTEDEKITRDSVREYCQAKLMPRIIKANRNEGKELSLLHSLVLALAFHRASWRFAYWADVSEKASLLVSCWIPCFALPPFLNGAPACP